MLKSRIITAAIIIPIFIALLFLLSPVAFSIITALIVIMCAFEWSFFLSVKSGVKLLVFPLVVLFVLLNLPYLFAAHLLSIYGVLYCSCIFWIIAAVLVALYPRYASIWSNSVITRGIMGLLVLIPCWLALNFIRTTPNGIYTLLFLFILIWGADIGAYFIGKKWGKHKLCPSVSPGKTVQGVSGALVITAIIAAAVLLITQTPQQLWLPTFLLCLVTIIFSIIGDLFESMMKRNVGLKDSSQILPGHGGLLDRLDSLTAAAPIFAFGMIWIGLHYI